MLTTPITLMPMATTGSASRLPSTVDFPRDDCRSPSRAVSDKRSDNRGGNRRTRTDVGGRSRRSRCTTPQAEPTSVLPGRSRGRIKHRLYGPSGVGRVRLGQGAAYPDPVETEEILVAFSLGESRPLGNLWRITAKRTDFYLDPLGEAGAFHLSMSRLTPRPPPPLRRRGT